MYIVIGLGNPGEKYAAHRHNVGAMVVDAVAARADVSFTSEKIFKSEIARVSADATVGGSELLLAKPTVFMNDSGESAALLLKQYPDAQLVVVYDEISVPVGEIKCSFGRGDGGHNGVTSVISHLGHKDFFRIRVGIRPVHEELIPKIAPPTGFETFMLSPFAPQEHDFKQAGIEKAIDVIESLSQKSFEQLMTENN